MYQIDVRRGPGAALLDKSKGQGGQRKQGMRATKVGGGVSGVFSRTPEGFTLAVMFDNQIRHYTAI